MNDPMASDGNDLGVTLSELERKLVALEGELQTVAVAPSVVPRPDGEAQQDRLDPGVRIVDLRSEIVELMRFRDHLESVARSLIEEYDGLVARLKRAAPGQDFMHAPIGGGQPLSSSTAAPEPAGPAATSSGAQEEAEGPSSTDRSVAETPAGEAPVADPQSADSSGDQTMEGAVVLDAGPFVDITSLQSFEQALARIDGAEDVYVRSFEGNRALIDLRLSNPVPLVQLLREQLSLPITARGTGEGRLSVDMAADSHGT